MKKCGSKEIQFYFFCFNFHTTLIPDDPVDKLFFLTSWACENFFLLLHKTMQSHTNKMSMCARNKKKETKINLCAWFVFNDNNDSSPKEEHLINLNFST